MNEEIKAISINCEKDKEIKFNVAFKFILGLSIFFSAFLSLAGVIYISHGVSGRVWQSDGINQFLFKSLFFVSIILCFISLISIAVTKRPFSKILVWCVFSIGILFVASSFAFPRIEGYATSGFTIISKGKFTFCDGTLLLFGLLGVLLSKVVKYGFLYQRNSDDTI